MLLANVPLDIFERQIQNDSTYRTGRSITAAMHRFDVLAQATRHFEGPFQTKLGTFVTVEARRIGLMLDEVMLRHFLLGDVSPWAVGAGERPFARVATHEMLGEAKSQRGRVFAPIA